MTLALTPGEYPVDGAALDQDLARRIRLFLGTLKIAILQRIHVQAKDGVVTLGGAIRTYYERQLAIACVKRVAGVRHVTDMILVRDDSPCPSAQPFHFNEVLR